MKNEEKTPKKTSPQCCNTFFFTPRTPGQVPCEERVLGVFESRKNQCQKGVVGEGFHMLPDHLTNNPTEAYWHSWDLLLMEGLIHRTAIWTTACYHAHKPQQRWFQFIVGSCWKTQMAWIDSSIESAFNIQAVVKQTFISRSSEDEYQQNVRLTIWTECEKKHRHFQADIPLIVQWAMQLISCVKNIVPWCLIRKAGTSY